MKLDLVFLVGRTTSSVVFWCVCELIMILGCLSANRWSCVPVLLVVWHEVSSTGASWSLSGTGSLHWDRDLWRVLANWYYVWPGGLWGSNVLNSALPPQRLRPYARPEHQYPVSHTVRHKQGKGYPGQGVPPGHTDSWTLWCPFIPLHLVLFHLLIGSCVKRRHVPS